MDFLDGELAALEAAVATQALASPEILRLMTVPGVNVNTAAAFMAAVGDIRRFPMAKRLVGYLGLACESGSRETAWHGSISKAFPSAEGSSAGALPWLCSQESVLRSRRPVRLESTHTRGTR